jgi:hypothetical protein
MDQRENNLSQGVPSNSVEPEASTGERADKPRDKKPVIDVTDDAAPPVQNSKEKEKEKEKERALLEKLYKEYNIDIDELLDSEENEKTYGLVLRIQKSNQDLKSKWAEMENLKGEMQTLEKKRDEIPSVVDNLEEGEIPNEMLQMDPEKAKKQRKNKLRTERQKIEGLKTSMINERQLKLDKLTQEYE